MLLQARLDSGMSQSKLASKLNVHRSTIANWESGYSPISLETAIEGFKVLGVPMYPYLMSAIYGEELKAITAGTDIHEIRASLHKFVDELDDMHTKELLYILQGHHGSSPTGTLDMTTAYLHLPLMTRVCVTENILNNYEINEALGLLDKTDNVLPKTETLRKCTAAAREAVLNGKNTYVV